MAILTALMIALEPMASAIDGEGATKTAGPFSSWLSRSLSYRLGLPGLQLAAFVVRNHGVGVDRGQYKDWSGQAVVYQQVIRGAI